MSRHHACLYKVNTDFFVEDIGSTYETFVSWRRIISPTILANGNSVRFANAQLVFEQSQLAAGKRVLPATRVSRKHQPFRLLLGIILLASVSALVLCLRQAAAASWFLDQSLRIALGATGGCAVLFAYYLLRGFAKRCPACKLWWGQDRTQTRAHRSAAIA